MRLIRIVSIVVIISLAFSTTSSQASDIIINNLQTDISSGCCISVGAHVFGTLGIKLKDVNSTSYYSTDQYSKDKILISDGYYNLFLGLSLKIDKYYNNTALSYENYTVNKIFLTNYTINYYSDVSSYNVGKNFSLEDVITLNNDYTLHYPNSKNYYNNTYVKYTFKGFIYSFAYQYGRTTEIKNSYSSNIITNFNISQFNIPPFPTSTKTSKNASFDMSLFFVAFLVIVLYKRKY